MPRAGSALTDFLRKYSKRGCGTRNLSKLYGQWKLIEVRDTGKRKNLRCHCGRTGLRYLAFIENRYTGIQTYVGSRCVKYFSKGTMPSLLKLLEGLSQNGHTAVYKGRKGKMHRFCLNPSSPLVHHQRLLKRYFRRLPVRRCPGGGWEMRVGMGRRFRKPRLRRGRRYRLVLGAVTPLRNKRKGQKPNLDLFADRVYACK